MVLLMFPLSLGNFPLLLMLMNRFFAYSEAGKGLKYVNKVALDLIKTRREAGQSEKVFSGCKI